MAAREKQKVKGCKKCGRSARKIAGTPISLYIRDKITAKEYFAQTGQQYKGQ
jgi:hypothetical protein